MIASAAVGLTSGPMAAARGDASSGVLPVEVVGDDDADAFVGTGGVLLPAGVDERTRRQVADCPGCRWRLTSPCVDTELGNAFDGQRSCQAAPTNCPDGTLRRAWHDPGSGTWRNLGLVCITERVHTVQSMGREARALLRQGVPPVDVLSLPAAGAVTQMPTFFSCRQTSAPIVLVRDLGGYQVRLEARPTWTWSFGDGVERVVHEAGALRAGTDIAHTYRRPGRWEVVCRTAWDAEFTVDGVGPFPVAEPVRQVARKELEVGEGWALLTP